MSSLLGLSACSKSSTNSGSGTSYTAEQLQTALRTASLRTTLSLPSADDIDSISSAADLKHQYDTLVDEYVTGEGLRAAFLDYFRVVTGMGPDDPDTDETDEDDVAQLIVHVIMNDRPYSEIYTAQYRVDSNSIEILGQDSGAPLNELAGIMTLKAWLAFYTGNDFLFNFVREVARFGECYQYPDPDPTAYVWDENNIAEKYLPSGGVGCNNCHQTMNVRRSVWYKFDDQGNYRTNPSATNMFGHEPTSTPTVIEPRAGATFKFTDIIRNPRDYGQQIADHPRFSRCTARRFLTYALGYESDLPGASGRLMYDFDTSSKTGDIELLDTWTSHLTSTCQMQIRCFLKDFFKSDDFIARVNFL
jgi:hypothetical protein